MGDLSDEVGFSDQALGLLSGFGLLGLLKELSDAVEAVVG